MQTHKPIGTDADGIPWLSKYESFPYNIHVLYLQRNVAPIDSASASSYKYISL